MKHNTIKSIVVGIFFIFSFCGCNHDNGSNVDIPVAVQVGDESAVVSGDVDVKKDEISATVYISAQSVEIQYNNSKTPNNNGEINQTEITTIFEDVTTSEFTTTPFTTNTDDEYKYDLETSLIGVWSGNYITGENQVKLDLTIYNHDEKAINAIFSFSSAVNKGSYFMSGNIIDENKINLTGEQWIDRPTGYAFLDISGVISYNDMTITDDSSSLYIKKVSNDIGSIPPKMEISNEGYLSSLTPYRMDGINDYMINNNYRTHTGNVYPNGFVATSGGVSSEHVISVCSYSPFELMYNLENKYTYIQGKVGFDDVSVSSTDLFGVGSFFQGTATITFLSNDEELYSLDLSTSDIPKEFSFSVNEIDQLIIKVDFPYNNFVIDNFNKFFNFIDVKLE